MQAPYSGRVVDAATGKPLKGALVMVVWQAEDTDINGMKNVVAIREVATGADGSFTVPGRQYCAKSFAVGSVISLQVFYEIKPADDTRKGTVADLVQQPTVTGAVRLSRFQSHSSNF